MQPVAFVAVCDPDVERRIREAAEAEERTLYGGSAPNDRLEALHHAGLETLTHTPSPMTFLRDIVERPSNEQAFLLVVTGHPTAGATLPTIAKKVLDAFARFVTGGQVDS